MLGDLRPQAKKGMWLFAEKDKSIIGFPEDDSELWGRCNRIFQVPRRLDHD
jgi:hypothetical protein